MTDERIDALIRRLDVPMDPDPDFVRSTYAALRPQARAARVSDASWIGRLLRDVRLILAGVRRPSTTRPAGVVWFLVLLVLATMVALAIVGALNRSIQNGPLIVSVGGELQAVDPIDGSIRAILPPGEDAQGVSRSPDGRLVAFWTIGGGRSRLYVVGVDGRDQRELGTDLRLGRVDAIDTWSSDSRFLATEVVLHGGGIGRILVGDVATGAARVVTPEGVIAHNPLWSPDGGSIAFTMETGNIRSIAIIGTDGSGMRTVSGDVVGAAGPDTWSPDGWIYFGDFAGRIYRANVAGGFTQRLSGDDLRAFAPTSSPDGTRIAFIAESLVTHNWYDLYIARSDGTAAHRLLEHATNDGWSADGRYVLAEWTPVDRPGGLALITPDGSEFQVVLPFAADCSTGSRQTCLKGVGWGQPRP